MLTVLHLTCAALHAVALFFPLVKWTFMELDGPTMTYKLGEITYTAGANISPSNVDNKPLLYLNIALLVLHVLLANTKLLLSVRPRLYNALALLGPAMLFSLSVTAYRAEKSIAFEVVSRSISLGAFAATGAVALALFLYVKVRFGTQESKR